MTDGSGSVQSELAYTPDGRVSQVQGSQSSDFQCAGYYFHGRSGLNLTLTRAYNATLNKWISRDKIGELGGTNLFAYASNNPVSFIDSSGKADIGNYIPKGNQKLKGHVSDGDDGDPDPVDTSPNPTGGPRPACEPCVSDPNYPSMQTPTRSGSTGSCRKGDGINYCGTPDGAIYNPQGRRICGYPAAPAPEPPHTIG